jgi:ABC-type Na+ efflux pump permease subunit
MHAWVHWQVLFRWVVDVVRRLRLLVAVVVLVLLLAVVLLAVTMSQTPSMYYGVEGNR